MLSAIGVAYCTASLLTVPSSADLILRSPKPGSTFATDEPKTSSSSMNSFRMQCDPLLVNDQCRVLTARDAYAFSRRRSDPLFTIGGLLYFHFCLSFLFAQESTADLPSFSFVLPSFLLRSYFVLTSFLLCSPCLPTVFSRYSPDPNASLTRSRRCLRLGAKNEGGIAGEDSWKTVGRQLEGRANKGRRQGKQGAKKEWNGSRRQRE